MSNKCPSPLQLTRVRVGLGGIAVALALTLTTGPLVAEEAPRLSRWAKRSHTFDFERVRQQMTRSLHVPLESASIEHQITVPGQGLHDAVMHEEMTNAAFGGARRAMRKAVRDYLMESIRLDRGIDQIKQSIPGANGGKMRDVDFSVGFHRMLPKVGMRYSFGQRNVGFSVGARGNIGVGFSPNRSGRSGVSASFDGDDTFRINARVGF